MKCIKILSIHFSINFYLLLIVNYYHVFSRTELLVTTEGLKKLQSAHVLIMGLGGVGGYVVEQLCRAGIGKLTLVDGDTIHQSNRNRQLIALCANDGELKAHEWEKRCRDINPKCEIEVIDHYITEEEIPEVVNLHAYDYVVDAIDTLSPKVALIFHCVQNNLKLVSSFGSGGKFDPTQVRIDKVEKSFGCPLGSVVRKRLHRLGIHKGFKVVYSPEKTPEHAMIEERSTNKRSTIGTISYMPPIFGCCCASVVVRDLLGIGN